MGSAIAAIGYVLAAAFAGLWWVEMSRRIDWVQRHADLLSACERHLRESEWLTSQEERRNRRRAREDRP